MVHTEAHLIENLFEEDYIQHIPVRDALRDALLEIAENDERIVVLCADVRDSVRVKEFSEQYPSRYIEVGVAEQNMAGIAAGLAEAGKIPFIVAYAVFSPGRNWEQVRTLIALSNTPVKIMGMHAGVTVGEDGATHQALEDITLMRVLPNMSIVVPSDVVEAKKAILESVSNNVPTYIRFSRHASPVFTTVQTPFERGRAEYVWRSTSPQVTLLGAGHVLYEALQAARELEGKGIGSSVLNLHSIKPMDIPRVLEAVRDARAVVTIEDHQILGGLGGTVAEVLTQNIPVPQEMVAVHDKFGQSGKPEELLAHYGLTREGIVRAALRAIERK